MPQTLLLKFSDEQREAWTKAAGKNLSGWIRSVCDAAANGKVVMPSESPRAPGNSTGAPVVTRGTPSAEAKTSVEVLPEFSFHPGVTQEIKVSGPLPNPEKFPDGIEVCDHGATKNKCQVMHCYFYEDPMGRATRGQYEAAKARKQAPLFKEPEDEVHQPEDVRRYRDVPAPGRRAGKAARPSGKTSKSQPKRGRRGDDEPETSRKCTAAVGPGIYCPRCKKRHS